MSTTCSCSRCSVISIAMSMFQKLGGLTQSCQLSRILRIPNHTNSPSPKLPTEIKDASSLPSSWDLSVRCGVRGSVARSLHSLRPGGGFKRSSKLKVRVLGCARPVTDGLRIPSRVSSVRCGAGATSRSAAAVDKRRVSPPASHAAVPPPV